MLTKICLSATALTLALVIGSNAQAQEVTLTAKDNSMTISGTLLGFEDRKYTIRSNLGEITVDADLMNCLGVACPTLKPPAASFRIAGDPLPMDDLLPALLQAYGQQSGTTVALDESAQTAELTDSEGDPLAKVAFAPSSSAAGFVELLQGEAQMVVATRAPRASEAEAFEKTGLGAIQSKDQEFLLGMQSIALVVSNDNPIEAISEETAAGILSGAIRNWSEIGGQDAPISVVGTDETSPSADALNEMLLSRHSATLRGDAARLGSDVRVAAQVASDETAIGFVGLDDIGQTRALAITGSCGIRSYPSDFAVKSESYPLTRRMTAYIAGEMPQQMEGFLNFLTSPDANRAAQNAGYVTSQIQTVPLKGESQRLVSAILTGPDTDDITVLQEMVRAMRDAEQLSTSLRFVPFTNVLDTRSHRDLKLIADELQSEEYAGKEVLLAGFTTAAANPAENLPLSFQRANLALQELKAVAPEIGNTVTLSAKGFGDISPLACGSTVGSDHINNRVELWVKDPQR